MDFARGFCMGAWRSGEFFYSDNDPLRLFSASEQDIEASPDMALNAIALHPRALAAVRRHPKPLYSVSLKFLSSPTGGAAAWGGVCAGTATGTGLRPRAVRQGFQHMNCTRLSFCSKAQPLPTKFNNTQHN
jgi:hypothetical protein